MILAIILLLVGLALLVAGGEALVRGASSISRRAGIPPLVIGLTIVAFGTSAPELMVNLFSAFRGTTDLALGNIIGSNISNILLILGICAIIATLKVQKSTTWKEIPFAALAIVMVFFMVNDVLFDGFFSNILSHIDGLVLLGFFLIFLYYIVGLARRGTNISPPEEIKTYPLPLSIILTIAGLLLLFFGGRLLVDQAVLLAQMAGLSEIMIGLTIVAVGTSLPELAASAIAARHGQTDIAIGNVVGSNIFNIFWVLGVTAVIKPLPISAGANFDILICLLVTVALFLAIFIGKKQQLGRWQGILFVIAYIAYIAFLIYRG